MSQQKLARKFLIESESEAETVEQVIDELNAYIDTSQSSAWTGSTKQQQGVWCGCQSSIG